MTRTRRLLYGLLLAVGAGMCAFMLGALVASRCCVPAGSGLAGPAIVFGYGVIAAVISALLAGLLAWSLPPRILHLLSLVVGLAGAVFFAIALKVYLDSRQASAEHLREAYGRMRPFSVALSYLPVTEEVPFRRAVLDWGQRSISFDADGQQCVHDLEGESAARMLGALREAEGVVFRSEFPCAGTLGDILRRMEYRIVEALPPENTATLAITEVCLATHPGLAAPFEVMEQLQKEISGSGTCSSHTDSVR